MPVVATATEQWLIWLASFGGVLQTLAIVAAVIELRSYISHRKNVFKNIDELDPTGQMMERLATDRMTGVNGLETLRALAALKEQWSPGVWAITAVLAGLLATFAGTAAGVLAAASG